MWLFSLNYKFENIICKVCRMVQCWIMTFLPFLGTTVRWIPLPDCTQMGCETASRLCFPTRSAHPSGFGVSTCTASGCVARLVTLSVFRVLSSAPIRMELISCRRNSMMPRRLGEVVGTYHGGVVFHLNSIGLTAWADLIPFGAIATSYFEVSSPLRFHLEIPVWIVLLTAGCMRQ